MKDLEKIKSEDLAAQVQDANPANFAIEQEVAQLVGATVPAPTEPSADDARELPAQLLVFLRRALLPIRSALRTAVAAIYAHLDSRCTAYTPAAYAPFRILPYDPMRPFAPRTLPNLLTALTAFSARKISNGSATADGIPDGTSLAHLLCSTDAANSVTEIVDDNTGWTCPVDRLRNLFSIFPNIEVLYIAFSSLPYPTNYGGGVAIGNTKIRRIYFTDWVHGDYPYDGGPRLLSQNSQLEEVHAPVMKTFNSGGYSLCGFTTGETSVEGGMKLYFDVIESISNYLVNTDGLRSVTANVSYILIGCTGLKSQQVAITYESSRTTWNTLLDVEIGDKERIDKGLVPRWIPCQNIHIQPQTLTAENMYNHLLLRLKQDEPLCGSGVTITLGSTNIAKLEAVEEYNTKLTELEDTYGYTFA